jgi:hypothetical protein
MLSAVSHILCFFIKLVLLGFVVAMRTGFTVAYPTSSYENCPFARCASTANVVYRGDDVF